MLHKENIMNAEQLAKQFEGDMENLARDAASNQWIDLRVSVPEYYKDVLVYDTEDVDAQISVCWLSNTGNKNVWTISGTPVIIQYVTHWRELPPPPFPTTK